MNKIAEKHFFPRKHLELQVTENEHFRHNHLLLLFFFFFFGGEGMIGENIITIRADFRQGMESVS